MIPCESRAQWRSLHPLLSRPLRPSPFLVGAVLVVGAALGFAARAADAMLHPTWTSIRRGTSLRFPDIPSISTGQLAEMLASPGAAKPVLIDVRSPEEYAVSHIPGAVSAARFEQQVATLRRVGANRLVVLYCSVGWRSAQAAENLIKSGATNVRNLDGSIFEWANENRPLVDHANAPTAFVHPYNETWGRLLDAGHRAPLHS